MSKAKKNVFVRILISVIIIICILASLLVAFFVGILQYNKKRAVIIVPGLFASALYDADTGKSVWDPFDDTDLWLTDIIRHGEFNGELIPYLLMNKRMQEELRHLTANDGHGDGEGFLYRFTAINEDGTSAFNIKPYSPDTESRYKYGLMNAQKDICDYFEAEYGKTYEVVHFNYDFRLDNRLNGKRLEDYINEKGYEEVILVSHSNGGLVVGSYLSRSEKNREKVSLYLSYDAPYLGAVTALATLENLEHMIDGVSGILEDVPVVPADVVDTAFHEQFLPLANMFTVYQLLPTYELLCSPQFYYQWKEAYHTPGKEPFEVMTDTEFPMVVMDGEEYYFYSQENLYDFYCSRPWAHLDNDLNKELRAGMKDWLDYVDSFYVMTENGRSHVTELVNTYYFCGLGYDTPINVEYITRTNGVTKAYDDEDWQQSVQGDGTVLLYSAAAGTLDPTRYVVIPFADHYDVVQYFDRFSKDATETIIQNNMDWKHKFLLKWNKKSRG